MGGTVYFPLDMAVGDFNNDGYANEIVVVDTNRIGVHYKLIQITHTGSTAKDAAFSIKQISGGDAGGYDYVNWNPIYAGRYANQDGVSCTYSICTVAGDFDADGQTEFAVIWRDTSPQVSRFTQFAGSYSLFVGYTGKIHVKTYKWNGTTFRTEETVQGFDKINNPKESLGQRFNDIDLPLGVKAAVGDFDGDGRDDIAVLRVMLQYSECYASGRVSTFSYSNFVFGAFVDWYTFDRGSIKPIYHAHPTNYGGAANGWVGIRATNISMPFFSQAGVSQNDTSQYNQNVIRMRYYLQPLTGEQTPYPLIDQEFDLIAGKFSGSVGTALVRDDLVIKYPQWTNSSGNKLRSHVALMTNIPGTTNATAQVHEITSVSERSHKIAFAKADFLDEGISLGDPERVIDTSEHDYTAILQMFPYHVDNISADGTALTKDPHNFTLRLNTEVKYNNIKIKRERYELHDVNHYRR